MGKDVQPLLLQEIRKELRATFGVPVEILGQKEVPLSAFNKFRGQYISDLLLEYLDKNVQETALGITNVDIYTRGMNFIFGQAKLKTAAVLSTHRLSQSIKREKVDDKLLLERMKKEAVHEIGHVLGLNHCKTKGCVMGFSVNTRDVDGKGKEFCHMCSIQLK